MFGLNQLQKHLTRGLCMKENGQKGRGIAKEIKYGQMVKFMKNNGLKVDIVGNGKLIHVDGNVYEGEWLNEEVNSYGQKGAEMQETGLKISNKDKGISFGQLSTQIWVMGGWKRTQWLDKDQVEQLKNKQKLEF